MNKLSEQYEENRNALDTSHKEGGLVKSINKYGLTRENGAYSLANKYGVAGSEEDAVLNRKRQR